MDLREELSVDPFLELSVPILEPLDLGHELCVLQPGLLLLPLAHPTH